MYAKPEKVDINSCYLMWKEFGIGEELATKVKEKAKEYQQNKKITETVLKIYNESLKMALSIK